MRKNPFDKSYTYMAKNITIDEIYGCTISSYVEYNPAATVYDGSCDTFAVFGCKSERQLNKIRKRVLSEKIIIKEYSSIYLEKPL